MIKSPSPSPKKPLLAATFTLCGIALLSLPAQAAKIIDEDFEGGDADRVPFADINWSAYFTKNETTVVDWSNAAVLEPGFVTRAAGTKYIFFAPARNDDFVIANGPGIFFTDLSAPVPITSMVSMVVDANLDSSPEFPAFARFIIQVGTQWYASEFEMTSITEDGANGAYNTETLDGIDFSDGANWRLLTASAVAEGEEPGGEISLAGAAVGGVLMGDVVSVGIYSEPGNAGDHSRFDNFVVIDDSPEPVGFLEEFTNEGPDANMGSIGWSALLTEDDAIVDYAPETGPFAAAVSTDDFGFFSPDQDPEVANDPALIFTDKQGEADVASFVSIDWDGRAQNLIEHVYRPAIRIDGVWYAGSTELFVESSEEFSNVLFEPASFVAADNWRVIENASAGAQDPLVLGIAPEADLTGMVTAYGLYVVAGSDGAQVSFDNFRIDAAFPAASESDFRITSFISVGGGVWEVTVRGDADTDYTFRSSATLDFPSGTLLENLTQGDPGDAGTIGGANDSVVTTDSNGDATVRVTLSGAPVDFVRAESAP